MTLLLILDAGCGVGGASIWLAENSSAKYIGITISPLQVEKARKYAKNRGVDGRVSVSVMDFHKTDFHNDTFDYIFLIESSCYANVQELSREMYRILKPTGKLVIADYAPPRMPQNDYEKKMVNYFCHGYKMSEWRTKDELLSQLRGAGFQKLTFLDKTAEIRKSVNRIYYQTLLTAIPFSILRLFRLISKVEFENGYATYSQKKLYEMGLFQYGIFIGEK
jgi:SAM-dependent methyltransferase